MSDMIHEVQSNFRFHHPEVGDDVDWKRNMQTLFSLKDEKLLTMQNQLMDRLVDKRLQAFKDSLSNTKLAWFVSLQSKEAGAWLEAIPKYEKLAMDSNTFRAALCYRFMLK